MTVNIGMVVSFCMIGGTGRFGNCVAVNADDLTDAAADDLRLRPCANSGGEEVVTIGLETMIG